MSPQHSYRGVMVSLLALVALAFTAMLSSAPDTSPPKASTPYTLFESGQVRPLALSPDERHLFAVNTPDNRLEVFRIEGHAARPHRLHPGGPRAGRRRGADGPRGLGGQPPLGQRERRRARRTTAATGHVERTLLVGDEPRDIVFAGPGAEAGVHHHGAPRPEHPVRSPAHDPGRGARGRLGVRRERSSAAPWAARRSTIVTLFTDTPRALAVTPDGTRVYAAGFHTGNRTTIVPETSLPDGFGPDGVPGTCHQRRRPPRARGRGHRQVERRSLGRRARPPLRPVREVLAARQGRVRDRRHGQPAAPAPGSGRLLPGRRHHPLQHGRQPREREGLRRQHRRQQRRAVRGPRDLRRGEPARPPAREPHHRALTRGRRGARGTSTSTSTTTAAARRSRTPRTTGPSPCRRAWP